MKKLFILFIILNLLQKGVSQTNTFPASGNVGIGTTNPQTTLDVSGVTRISGSVIGGKFLSVYSSNDEYYKIASLPPSSLGTYDHIIIEGIFNTNWSSVENVPYKIIAGNRNGLVVKYYEGIQATVGIQFYVEGDGSVSVWLKMNANCYASASVNISASIQVTTYPNFPLGTPTGTLSFSTQSAIPYLNYSSTGNVGIGTTNPNATLEVDNNSINTAGLLVRGQSGDNWFPYYDGKNYIRGTTIIGDLGGNVGIGTANPGSFKLAVEGNIGARKVIVTKTSPFPDYVFNEDYKLPSLTQVEQFIKANKHLPEVPTAKEVEKNGLDLGDNQTTLLKKIEELTLYLIEQNKKNEEQSSEIKGLKNQLLQQQKEIEQLQQ